MNLLTPLADAPTTLPAATLPAAPPMTLGYLHFEVRRLARWQDFLDDTLGLPRAEAAPAVPGLAEVQGWRLDEACHGLLLGAGPRDDLSAIGLDCGDEAGLARRVQRLRAAGVAVRPGDAALCRSRRVARLWLATDPAGTTVELYCGLAAAATPFASPVFGGGFRTGLLGIGHVALVAHDLAAMERFYVQALGFAVTERLHTRSGPLAIEATFLHCNRRHHSLALMKLPLRQRLHHFMLQTERLADVGRAHERLRQRGEPLGLDLGQHPDPDGTFSFYGLTPSGFQFEIGHGSQEIDPARWTAQPSSTTSTWGHRPTWRLQWQMARGMLGQWWRAGH